MNAARRDELKETIAKNLSAEKVAKFVSDMRCNHGSMIINGNETGPHSFGYGRLSDGRVIYIESKVNANGTAQILEIIEVAPELIKKEEKELNFADVANADTRKNFFAGALRIPQQ